jgi:hypothetical protein
VTKDFQVQKFFGLTKFLEVLHCGARQTHKNSLEVFHWRGSVGVEKIQGFSLARLRRAPK